MFRSGRYSDINVPVNFPVRTKFMPYPHKNSDGVIPKKVEPDIWGGKPAPGEAQPFTQTVDKLKKLLEDTYGLPVVEHKDLYANKAYFSNPSFAQYVPPPSVVANMSLVEKEKLLNQLKKYGVIPNSWEYKEDPILIPATEVKKWFWEPGDPVVAPMHSVVDLTVYTNMPGLAKNHNKVGASWVIDPTHDYTESEIRARLQQGFKAMEELIIKSLKENKK